MKELKCSPVKGRANTDSDKEVIMRRLLAVWKCMPELRLGQLIMNATNNPDIFYVEDFDLLKCVEDFAARFGDNHAETSRKD